MATKDRQRNVFVAEEPHRAEGAEAPADPNPDPKASSKERVVDLVRLMRARGELWRLMR